MKCILCGKEICRGQESIIDFHGEMRAAHRDCGFHIDSEEIHLTKALKHYRETHVEGHDE